MSSHTSEEITRLTTQRDELRARIEAINADFRQRLDTDSEERAVQLENREVLEAIAKAATEDLQRIDKRLAELKGH